MRHVVPATAQKCLGCISIDTGTISKVGNGGLDLGLWFTCCCMTNVSNNKDRSKLLSILMVIHLSRNPVFLPCLRWVYMLLQPHVDETTPTCGGQWLKMLTGKTVILRRNLCRYAPYFLNYKTLRGRFTIVFASRLCRKMYQNLVHFSTFHGSLDGGSIALMCWNFCWCTVS